MPPLNNFRHERFAQALAQNADAVAAYRSAGYSAAGDAAGARASRLLNDTAVAARIAELQTASSAAATPMEVTTANAIREFEEARLLAIKKGQASAAVTATMAKARLAGLLAGTPEGKPAPAAKFDGNYTDAARRIAFLLRLSANETSDGQQR
jgi:hypothetical protein